MFFESSPNFLPAISLVQLGSACPRDAGIVGDRVEIGLDDRRHRAVHQLRRGSCSAAAPAPWAGAAAAAPRAGRQPGRGRCGRCAGRGRGAGAGVLPVSGRGGVRHWLGQSATDCGRGRSAGRAGRSRREPAARAAPPARGTRYGIGTAAGPSAGGASTISCDGPMRQDRLPALDPAEEQQAVHARRWPRSRSTASAARAAGGAQVAGASSPRRMRLERPAEPSGGDPQPIRHRR